VISERSFWLVIVGAAIACVAAYAFYFAQPEVLLDGSRIDSYAYGPEGTNIREFEVHARTGDDGFVDHVLASVNTAALSNVPVVRREGGLLLVLFREDGLQYHLVEGDDTHVGISEGDGSYLGSLESRELALVMAALAAEMDAR